MKSEEKKIKKENRSLKIALFVVLIVVVLAAGSVLVWYNFIREPDEFERYQFDTDALEGRIAQMTEEEIVAELNRVVEEGMFNISIASTVVFDPKTELGEARIENIAANHYHMQVDITLDETGDEVYSSKLIRPGYSVKEIKLKKKLEPGVYEATAIFSAISQEEFQLVGTAGAKIRLFVPDKNGNIPRPTPTPTPANTPQPTVSAE